MPGVRCEPCGRLRKTNPCSACGIGQWMKGAPRCSLCKIVLQNERQGHAGHAVCDECERRKSLAGSTQRSNRTRARQDEVANGKRKAYLRSDQPTSFYAVRSNGEPICFTVGGGAGYLDAELMRSGLQIGGCIEHSPCMAQQYDANTNGAEVLPLTFDANSTSAAAEWISGVCRARDSKHVHLSLTLSCEGISAASTLSNPEQVEEDSRCFYELVCKLRETHHVVTWWAENVDHEAFILSMLKHFPEAEMVRFWSSMFGGEKRKRAFISSPEFDLSALLLIDEGTCSLNDFLPEAAEVGSASCGSNAARQWKPASDQSPTITGNGLYWRPAHVTRSVTPTLVLPDVLARLRGFPLVDCPEAGVVALRLGVARAVSGGVSRELARQLRALTAK